MGVIGAVVIVDPLLDDVEYEWLLSLGLRIYKLNSFSDILRMPNRKGHYLFFENPRMRFDIEQVIKILNTTGGLNLIKDKKTDRIVALDPSKVTVSNGFINADYPFLLNDVGLIELPPKIAMPDIYMLVHSRHEYLKLTLNSLLYSFGDGQNKWPKIRIFMNEPEIKVFDLVCEYQQKYSNIEWYKSDINLKFKAIRAMIDYFNPHIFLYAEEDFILPKNVRKDYPYWPQQFAALAEKGGFVGWRATNIPKEFYNPDWVRNLFMKVPDKPTFDHRWDINYEIERFIAGHLMAIKSSIYKNIDSFRTIPAVDHHISASVRFEASPTTFGYHLGYNNCMDYDDYLKRHSVPDYRGEVLVVDHCGNKHMMNAK